MILAASMGPMPKISMRLVSEASTSASMGPSRSAIFRSSARTSRRISESNHRRTRRGALRSYAAQDAGDSGSRECPRYSAGNEVPQESVQAVERSGTLGDQVFTPLRKETQHLRSSLGIDRRQPLVAPGG